jgi:hypothetical protein
MLLWTAPEAEKHRSYSSTLLSKLLLPLSDLPVFQGKTPQIRNLLMHAGVSSAFSTIGHIRKTTATRLHHLHDKEHCDILPKYQINNRKN